MISTPFLSRLDRAALRSRTFLPPRRPVRYIPHQRVQLLNMAAGDRLLDASGNVILGSGGGRQLSSGAGDECCCGEGGGGGTGDPCIKCDTDTTPAMITVAISGVTLCSSCAFMGSGWFKFTGDSVNGTYDCAQFVDDPCRYRVSGSKTWTLQLYSDSGCTSPLGFPFTYDNYQVDVSFVSGQINIDFTVFPPSGPGSAHLFSHTINLTDPFDCSVSHTGLANDFTSCNSSSSAPDGPATGGTAALTPS